MSTRWENWLRVIQTVVTAGLLVWMPWVSREIVICQVFRSAGPRITQDSLNSLKTEMRGEWRQEVAEMNKQLLENSILLKQINELVKQHINREVK